MVCPNCGKEISPNDVFCSYCGKSCQNSEQEKQTQQNQQAQEPQAPVAEEIEEKVEEMAETESAEKVFVERNAEEPVVVKKKSSTKAVLIASISVLLVAVFAVVFFFTNWFKSDKELIENRINTFVAKINSGDYDDIKNCMDKKTREKRDSGDEAVNEIIKDSIGLDVGLEDLFKFGMGFIAEDILKVEEITDIKIDGDIAVAKVKVKLNIMFLGDYTETFNVKLVKEKKNFIDSDWYITDIDMNAGKKEVVA